MSEGAHPDSEGQACLRELAHIVSPDYGPGNELREPRLGRDSSKGHHHAWRVNQAVDKMFDPDDEEAGA